MPPLKGWRYTGTRQRKRPNSRRTGRWATLKFKSAFSESVATYRVSELLTWGRERRECDSRKTAFAVCPLGKGKDEK